VAPQVGSDFGGYRIDAEIGRGGMGVVYRAWQHRLGRPVALKVLATDAAAEPGYRDRFGREAAALARLDSPHVIQIHDHGEVDGNLYLAMQLVSGPDLAKVLASGPLPPRRALGVVAQVAAALGDAQAVGVVHRDVKPGNVLLRQRADHDDEDFAYLCDFGIARTVADVPGDGTGTGGVVGTIGFLAPERIDGAAASGASDVYSLGCLLWTVLTGAQPYTGSAAQVLRAHLDAPAPRLDGDDPRTAAVNDLLGAMMARDPAARPDARGIRERIRAIRDGRPVAGPVPAGGGTPLPDAGADRTVARPPGTAPDGAPPAGAARVPGRSRTGAPARRPSRRTVLVAGATALVAAVAVGAGVTLTSGPAPADRVADSVPLAATGCRPVDPGPDDVQARTVCTAGPGLGELRISALPSAADAEAYLGTVAGRDLAVLRSGRCPDDLPARQGWERGGGHGGTMVCVVSGTATRYAWSDEARATVAVLDGAPDRPYPADLRAVQAFVTDLGFG
jgi:hypothetical protein